MIPIRIKLFMHAWCLKITMGNLLKIDAFLNSMYGVDDESQEKQSICRTFLTEKISESDLVGLILSWKGNLPFLFNRSSFILLYEIEFLKIHGNIGLKR